MTKDSSYDRGHLKRRLLKKGLIQNECEICNQTEEHNGLYLVMVLDHINGINNDHRIENLRMLCPNCNSQQDTFAGRASRKKEDEKKKHYCDCGTEKTRGCKRCRPCADIEKIKNSNRPSREQLIKDRKSMTLVQTGNKYGVSETSVRKWIKKYNIP